MSTHTRRRVACPDVAKDGTAVDAAAVADAADVAYVVDVADVADVVGVGVAAVATDCDCIRAVAVK